MSVGIFNYFETSDSSKIFKYSVNVFADLAALIGVENLDLAFVSTTTGIFGFRNLKGLYQYKGGAWVYASKDLQDLAIAQQSEIDNNEQAITDLENTKLESVTGDGVDNTDPLNPVLSFESAASIKTKYESNADTNDFTDSEKTKLSGLESSKFLGEFTSLAALQTAFPTASVGSYAYVDTGVGQDVQKYIWDNNDSQWVEQQGQSTAETPATIKTKYESNADTNGFTDSEKTKLSNQSGTNTGDETTATIQSKRPIKTVNNQSLEGSGNITISGGGGGVKAASFISTVQQNVGTLLNGTGTNIQINLTNVLGPNSLGYGLSSGNVTIPTAGWYKVSLKGLTFSTSNNRQNTSFVVKRNSVDIAGTRVTGYIRNTLNNESSAAGGPIIPQFQFSQGDTIGLYAITAGDTSQTSFTTPQECVLSLELLS